MVIVVREAREPRQAAVVSLPLPLFLLPLLFPPADLVVQLGLPVRFLRRLPAGHENVSGPPFSTMTSAANRGQRWRQAPDPLLPIMLAPPFPSLWDGPPLFPALPPFIKRRETAAPYWHKLLSVFPGAS